MAHKVKSRKDDAGMQWDLERLRTLQLKHPYFKSPVCDPDQLWDCFALFGYIPRIGWRDEDEAYVQKLIIAFKENEPAAVTAIATLVAEEMLGEDDEDQIWHRSILVAPSSTTGVGKPSLNLLATVLERIRLQQGIVVKENTHDLTRHTALITPSHRERKNIDDHLATIKLEARNEEAGPITLSDEIVVIDDVYTKGATFSACKKIILDIEPEAEVLGFFLAKTWERNDTP